MVQKWEIAKEGGKALLYSADCKINHKFIAKPSERNPGKLWVSIAKYFTTEMSCHFR